jgi:hypothetical protein
MIRPAFIALLGVLTACGSTEAPDPGVTWHQDVAPVVAQHCAGCHTAGAIAPFALDTFAEAAEWGPALLASIESGSMPPFDARTTDECTPTHGFAHDLRMQPEEIALMKAWADNEFAEGDPATPAPMPEPWVDELEEVDATIQMDKPFSVDGNRDVYMCFRVPAPVDADAWIKGMQVLPDNDLVVHHVLVWTDPEDQSAELDDGEGYPCDGLPGFYPTDLIGIWTPGAGPMRTPPNTGIPIEPGASFVINVHYHPTGKGAELDQTSVAFDFTTEPPDQHVTWFLADIPFGAQVVERNGEDDFEIPAGVADHVEELVLDPSELLGFDLPFEFPIYAVTPHMHYLGRDMLVNLRKRNGDDECLVHTPDYRFNWQTTYVYDTTLDQLPVWGPGDAIEIRCTYDNSWSNPFMGDNLDAMGITEPRDVRWGEETGDEMCMAMLGLITPKELNSIIESLF